MHNTNNYPSKSDSTEPSLQPKETQEQSDPQLTELAGFTDSNEDLEPTLTDGTKAPDKAPPANVND
ncbi:MAG TPA: hypothetical protein VM884_10820 [Flavisolibacter sp.]|nr:hypothetical protein [Flavisolibacter sp.]